MLSENSRFTTNLCFDQESYDPDSHPTTTGPVSGSPHARTTWWTGYKQSFGRSKGPIKSSSPVSAQEVPFVVTIPSFLELLLIISEDRSPFASEWSIGNSLTRVMDRSLKRLIQTCNSSWVLNLACFETRDKYWNRNPKRSGGAWCCRPYVV
ncbi:hypothetical protein L1987_78148 [Smallanthus sonchifolius]|uniref:Uncharacterized protein n=1 Tax=Smallanthus sonchifolius TaxID=185202 RepID=A0ACB8ZB13_9ASTR|nr:hypothetical protein L1987_78148 [Smallanthus sonchifolius]